MKKQLITITALAIVAGGTTVAAHALSVQPSQEFGKSSNVLTVQPAQVTSFSQLTEPNDIQPALGYNVLQRTANPQAQVND